MAKKTVKKLIAKLRVKHEKTIDLIKRYPAASLALGVLAVLIACGNPFVVGAILGGLLVGKQVEDLNAQNKLHETPIILSVTIGALLGGLAVLILILIGASFGPAGIILGATIGVLATALFIAQLSEQIVFKVLHCKRFSKRSTYRAKRYLH